mgnify:FL=1
MNSRHTDSSYGRALYQETIRWSLLLWAFILFIDASIILAVWAALSSIATWICAIAICVLTLYLLVNSTLRITLTQGWLLVGSAAIERAFIYDFKAMDRKAMALARGVNGNPLDFLQIRFWVNTGIQMKLRDPRDKTTTWLISTRRPDELVKLLSNPKH